MTNSAYAAYDVSYTQRTPYLTVQEYQNAPTAMDIFNLIPGGDINVQMQALTEVISRASSWIDQYTCGAWGTLCATQNVENGRVWGNRYGQIIVHPKYWPILSVDTFSYSAVTAPGWGAAGATAGFGTNAASISPAGNVWIEPQQFIVQPGGTAQWNLNSTYGITTSEYLCQWTYTNGWPVTTLAQPAVAGDTSITPVTVTGIYPGTNLKIYDMPIDEAITVASTYVPGSAVVPLVSPLWTSHSTSAMITNIPPAIKQAAILATTAFIKQRGSGALVVQDIGELSRTINGASQNSLSDWDQAETLLKPFRQIMVGY
jgi:hypothetical protein